MKCEGKRFPGKGNSRCKGPEAGTRSVCFRKKAEWRRLPKSGGKHQKRNGQAGTSSPGLLGKEVVPGAMEEGRLAHCGR